MLIPENILKSLIDHKISFFAGVPDSLLKDFCACITDQVPSSQHIIAANEGNAVALAMGYYLATNKPGLVYMQNSGLGNTVNPLMSLVDPLVYSIPMLLVVGYRGEPGVADEPQHKKQGIITLPLLQTLDIPYQVLSDQEEDFELAITTALNSINERKAPYALVIKEGTFSPYKSINTPSSNASLSREEALKQVIDLMSDKDIVVSTTGKLSRELFELREMIDKNHERDFLTVGGMGHTSSIALGIALARPDRSVYCLDGDGSMIMHMGSLGIVGQSQPNNLRHFVFNNQVHDSVGGQPTAASNMDFPAIAKACGYKKVFKVQTSEELKQCFIDLATQTGPVFVEILVQPGARKDLGRPTRTPLENKDDFMKFIHDGQ